MKRKKKKLSPWLSGILAVFIVFLMAVVLIVLFPETQHQNEQENSKEEKNEISQTGVTQEEAESEIDQEESEVENETIVGLKFPYSLPESDLVITSVFQYDGLNPDCENQEGNEIAAITVKNISDTYLSSAEINLISNSGEEFCFVLTDLPANKEVMVFSNENKSSKIGDVYVGVECGTVFDTEASMNDDRIAVSVNGVHITLQNNTDEDISEIDVYCRSSLGDQYFGGITYSYTINDLPAYGTAELDAVDCILGLAEVVRIAIN